MPLVKLDVLDRMAETEFIDACASGDVASDFDDGQVIDQLFRV